MANLQPTYKRRYIVGLHNLRSHHILLLAGEQLRSVQDVVRGVWVVCVRRIIIWVGGQQARSGVGQMYYEIIKSCILDHTRSKNAPPTKVIISEDLAKPLGREIAAKHLEHQCFPVPWYPSAIMQPSHIGLFWNDLYLNIKIELNIPDEAM